MSSFNCQRSSFGRFSEQSAKHFLSPPVVIVGFARYVIMPVYIEQKYLQL